MSSIVSFVSSASVSRRQAVDAGALEQIGELLAGIEHPGLHRALRNADDRAGLFHRLLVVIDEVDDLAMRRRQLGDAGAQDGAGIAAVQRSFRGVGLSAISSTSSWSMSSCRRWRSAVSALKRAIDNSQVETWERPSNWLAVRHTSRKTWLTRSSAIGGVAHDAQDETVNPHIVPAIKDVHRGPAAIGNAFQQHFVRGRLGGDDALAGCGIDGNDVLHDRLPVIAAWRRLVGQIVNRLLQPTFRDVCTKSGKWFRARENCFV
jgi:hypothetical protein